MRITVLTHNLSSNAAMRAHRLAQAASRFSDVTLIGPVARAGPWPALPRDIPIVSVKKRRFPDFFGRFVDLVEKASGDVLIAAKPHLASFGVALVAAEKREVPVILDVDDLEVALTRDKVEVNNVPIAQNDFLARMQRELSGKTRTEDRIVVVRSAKDTPYNHWVLVTSLIEQAGGIITLQMEEDRVVPVQ